MFQARCNKAAAVLVMAASLLFSCTQAAVEQGVDHETARSGLASAFITQDGFLQLGTVGPGPFRFTLRAPLDDVKAGVDIVVENMEGWQITFTALIPAESAEGLSQFGQLPPIDSNGCPVSDGQVEGDESGCYVPYVGYGTDLPVDLTIEPGGKSGRARIFFHEFSSDPGGVIVLDYLLQYAFWTPDGGCHTFYDYSSRPVKFVVGKDLLLSAESEGAGWAVAGPVFPSELEVKCSSPGCCKTDECLADQLPIPFVDFCPIPSHSTSPQCTKSGSHWYYLCKEVFPNLPGYPEL